MGNSDHADFAAHRPDGQVLWRVSVADLVQDAEFSRFPDLDLPCRRTSMTDTVASLMAEIADVGTDPARGGYSRPVYSTAELDLRSWFAGHAERRGLDVQTDRNGIIWAWSGGVGDGAVVTGSHLDSVPGGGAYDGPLGVASSLVAFDRLAERGVPDRRAIAVFPEEEGSRFGLACLGSRLLTGAIDPDRARTLTDADGTTFAEATRRAGLDPARLGPDPETLARIGTFVELHVEQGLGLVDHDRPVAVASSILGHGGWRIGFTDEGNHAGTTLMSGRRDPMVAAAVLISDVQRLARRIPDARATVGRLVPTPGGTNVIASRVDVWLDVRHPDDAVTRLLVAEIEAAAKTAAAEQDCTAVITEESFSTAMFFVRNPTGVSHAPGEAVEDADAESGAQALADSLEALLRTP